MGRRRQEPPRGGHAFQLSLFARSRSRYTQRVNWKRESSEL